MVEERQSNVVAGSVEGGPDRRELDEDHRMPQWREVFLYFLMLGFINVGGRGDGHRHRIRNLADAALSREIFGVSFDGAIVARQMYIEVKQKAC